MNDRECDGEDCEIRGAHVGRTGLAVPRETLFPQAEADEQRVEDIFDADPSDQTL